MFLLVGLRYDITVWRALWPRIIRSPIEAAKRANSRLVFFDNVYMYGKVEGAMTNLLGVGTVLLQVVRRAASCRMARYAVEGHS